MRTIELLREATDDLCPGRVGQALQFLEVFVDVMTRRGALDRRPNK